MNQAATLRCVAATLALLLSIPGMARALETIAIAADLKARALPAVAAWISARK